MNWADHAALARDLRALQARLNALTLPADAIPAAASFRVRLLDLLHQLSLFRDAADRLSLEQYHEQTTIYYDSPAESWTATLRNAIAEESR